jgi:TRAP-type C4-dicarboxylate transport system permease large subunit
VTAALFLLVSFLDWLREPESRSHLGRFFQTLLDGDAWDVVARKLQQNIDILFGNYRLSLLVPIALVFVIYVLARPTSWGSRSLQRSYEAVPTLRPGLIALLITLTIGFGINDSGVAIPANGAILAVPLIIAVSVRVLMDEARASASTRVLRRG